MLFIIFLLGLLDVKHNPTAIDRVDLIEWNDVYDADFKEKRFTQLLFWEFGQKRDVETHKSSWQLWIGDWRIVKKPSVYYSHKKKEWVVIFHDTKTQTVRIVTATSYRHTQANFDREVEARKKLPVENRTPALSSP